MSEHTAFVRAIHDSPEDDALRLVFADWLGEHASESWAECVRCQVCAGALGESDPRRNDFEDRADDLVIAHEREWLGRWAEVLVDWEFRRGFPDAVVLTPAAFVEHGGELLDELPVAGVRFVGEDGGAVTNDDIRRITRSPAFARVRRLHTSGSAGGPTPWVEAMISVRHALSLAEIDFNEDESERGSFLPLSSGGDYLLTTMTNLPSLTRLRFGEEGPEQMDRASATFLARAEFAGRLEVLDLRRASVTESAVDIVSGSAFPNLRELFFGDAECSGEPMAPCGGGGFAARQLRVLGLGAGFSLAELGASAAGPLELHLSFRNGISSAFASGVSDVKPAAFEAHCQSSACVERLNQAFEAKAFTRAKEVRLIGNPWDHYALPGDDILAAMSTPGTCPALRRLSVTGHVSDRGACAIAGSPLLGQLTSLRIACHDVNSVGRDAFLRSPHLRGRLRELEFSRRNPLLNVVWGLADSAGVARVRETYLGQLSARSVEPLLRYVATSGLKRIRLAATPETVTAFATLERPANLRRLEIVDVNTGTDFGPLRRRYGPHLRALFLGGNPHGDWFDPFDPH